MEKTSNYKKFISIKIKASIFMSLASIIIVLTGLSVIYFFSSRFIKNSAIQSQKKMTEMLAMSVSKMIEKEIEEIKLVTSRTALKKSLIIKNAKYNDKNRLKIKTKTENPINIDLKKILKFEDDIFEFVITDKFGELLTSTNNTSDLFHADQEWWKKTYNKGIGKVFIGKINVDRAKDSFVIPIAIPIKDNSGDIIGICKALIDAKNLWQPIENFFLGERGYAVLTDGKGKILFHPKVDAYGSDFTKQTSFSQIINNKDEWILIDSPHIHNEEIFITMAKVNEKTLKANGISWIVFIDQDARILFAPLKRFVKYSIYSIPFITLISILFGIVFGGIFTKPLNKLTLASKAIGKGDLKINLNIETNDEIGILANEVNKMVKKLNQNTTSIDILNEEIKQRKETENSLNRLTKEWRNTFDSMTDLIFIQDNNCIITKANRAFFETMQLAPKDVIGKKCYNVLSGTYEPWGCCPFKGNSAQLKTKTATIKDPNRNMHLLITTSPVFDENGKKSGTVHHAKDITEQKKAEELIKKNQKELEEQTWGLQKTNDSIKILYKGIKEQNIKLKEYDRLKSEFISTVSHELRTPLSIIKESIGLILDKITGEINEEQEKILHPAKTNIDRLSRIINDLLDISKIEAGKIEIKKTLTNLTSLIDYTVKSFIPEAKKKGLQIRTNIPMDPIEMYVDSDKVIQILTNLIGNAIKFTKNGHIEVAVSENKKMVKFSVKDTGIGIPNDDLITIFDKFHQIGRTFGPGIKGTGLGLTISKQLIEMHNGTIFVVSKPGIGSTFKFEIPRPNPLETFKDILRKELSTIDKNNKKNISIILINIVDYKQIIETLGLKFYEDFFNSIIKESKNCFRSFEDKIFGKDGRIVILVEDMSRQNSLAVKNRIEKRISKLINNYDYPEIKNLTFTINIASHHDETKEFMNIVKRIERFI